MSGKSIALYLSIFFAFAAAARGVQNNLPKR